MQHIASAQLAPLAHDAAFAANPLNVLLDGDTQSGAFDPAATAGWSPGAGGGVLGFTNTATMLEQWDIIFVSEFAGWKNNLDIALNVTAAGAIDGSSTVLNVFENVDLPTPTLGDYRRLTVQNNMVGFFDFILDSTDATDAGGADGGKWRMYYPAFNDPTSGFSYGYTDNGSANTYNAGTGTVLFAFEDWNQNTSGVTPNNPAPDDDRNDFVFALQFAGYTAVPEPSTYGIIGAIALLGLIAARRIKGLKA